MYTVNQSGGLEPAQPFVDKKRNLWLLGLIVPNIANAAFFGYQFAPKSTQKIFASCGIWAMHIVIPILDHHMGTDTENIPEQDIQALENDKYYSNVIKCFIPFQYIANLYGNYLVSRSNVPFADKILLGHIMGILNGIAINTAHELSHKSGKLEHYLAHLCLAPTGYNHFRIEHPYGHHRRVATPEDPASAQLGEGFWTFWPRTVIGSFKSAIAIENRRLARKGKTFFCFENELIQGWMISLSYHVVMLKLFGPAIIPSQLVQAFWGITLFEAVNYLEHYGLKRKCLANGQYVKTQPEHSWNNNSKLSNLLLYQLQRHSDHHAFPTRSYQSLRHYEDVPQLPAGYASMIVPVFFPRWWFKLMNERVIRHYDGKAQDINIYPQARQKILQQYAHLFRPTFA